MATLYSEVIGLENTENSLTLGFALVTPSGLKFENVFYTNGMMIKHGWFELAQREEGWQIPILYDSKDLTRIMLLDIDSTKGAFQIEDASQKIDSEMRELYFSAIASLKVQLRHNKNK
ncbi:hypothetical protein [Paenibacillus stellifer]|uniref:hypothetical protein n=1 Tax=Paenibacillus stellifer TaxID=169760 RepID=UPI00147080B7|nr:hypothetical protein [Paenibacillus stellifer]